MANADAAVNARTLCQWLVSQGVLTGYQAAVLQAGRSGPFFYGDYQVYDRCESETLAGMFRARHVLTNHPVLLRFFGAADVQDAHQWAQRSQAVRKQCEVLDSRLQRWYELVDLTAFKFTALEDIKGKPLSEKLPPGKKAKVPAACRLIRDIAQALKALHQAGIVHGHIGPQSIWLLSGGRAALVRDPVRPPTPLLLHGVEPNEYHVMLSDYAAPQLGAARHVPGRVERYLWRWVACSTGC